MKQRLEQEKKRIVQSHSEHPCSVQVKQPADRNRHRTTKHQEHQHGF